jgi:nitroimidazol reductase NimA-like FMN-containing flavoprotein (pyridoxamine 5'-phosphate oxidase superfamily)
MSSAAGAGPSSWTHEQEDPMDVDDEARRLIDANPYLTLATVDGQGRPWATPVWYAPRGSAEFHWVSRPGSRHSRNIAGSPAVALTIFDSAVPVGAARALYAEAEAAEVDAGEIAVFREHARRRGIGEWTPDRVREPAALRLYRARVSALFVLDEDERRVPVQPWLPR